MSLNMLRSVLKVTRPSSALRIISKNNFKVPACTNCLRWQNDIKMDRSFATSIARQTKTEGDRQISEFLAEEINLEKASEKTPGLLPRIQGFEISVNDAEVTVSKKDKGELVTVKFNVNHTVDDEGPTDLEGNPEATQMVSRPPFVVEIDKGTGTTLAIQCAFPMEDIPEELKQQEQEGDLIEIQEAVLLSGPEWTDKVYAVSGAIMDGNLYDMLLNMLEERGITVDFIDQMVEFSTSYEHKKYIGFLEGLQDFIKA